MNIPGHLNPGTATLYLLFFIVMFNTHHKGSVTESSRDYQKIIKLPSPVYTGNTSVEEAFHKRRSVREYRKAALSINDISQLCWAAQGITSEDGGRTVPSAGALYPLELYVVCGNVTGIDPAVYHYVPGEHSLELTDEGDKRNLLYPAALFQPAIKRAAAVFVITGVYERTTGKYFERGKRYVHMEAGHASQNIYLEAAALRLGTVAMGAFTDSLVKKVLHLPRNEETLYLMPVGKL